MPEPLLCPLRESARRTADAVALEAPGRAFTYAELDGLVSGAADRLRSFVQAGTGRIGLHLPNSWELVVLTWATIRAGGVACLLSTRLPAAGVREHLERAGCGCLISADVALRSERERVTVVRPADVLGAGGPESRRGRFELAADRPATVVFTSGSTGVPKAALHAFGNHYFNALGSNENLPLASGDRWLLALPLYHVGGLAILFRCFLAGATAVLPGAGETLGAALVRHQITHASLVATQLIRLLREEGAGLVGVKAILLGGSAMPPGLIDAARKRALPVYTTYGLTEMASQVTTTPPAPDPRVLTTSGRVLPYRELRLAEDGEILVRGRTLFLGYLTPDGLDPAVDADRWFHTRDRGRLDDGGFLHVLGRTDNMFISGGENIQPETIEEVLGRLDGVERALVVPVPDAEFGRRPVAFVQAADGRMQETRWREALARELPRFMLPVAFFRWPDEEQGFKPDRSEMQREAASRIWQRDARSS